jgi:hypothetical protein
MKPEDKLQKMFELSDFTKHLFKEGLKQRFTEKSDAEIHELYLKRLEKSYNRNY